jgi:hypothetical protein
MDESKDFLKEDGYLAVSDCLDIHKIIFHPNLNVILIFTKSNIQVLDVNSGVVLQRVSASGVYEMEGGGEVCVEFRRFRRLVRVLELT